MVGLSTLAAGCALVTLLWLAGLATAALLDVDGEADDARGARLLLVSLAHGLGILPTLALFLHLLTGVLLSWWILAAFGGANLAICVALRARRRGPGGIRALLGVDALIARGALPVLAAALAVGAFYVLTYDDSARSPVESCAYGAALVATGDLEYAAGTDLLRENFDDARLGNAGVIAAQVLAWQGLGFRMLFGLCGLLLALGGYLIGGRAGETPAWAFAGMALLALNPWVVALPQADQNLLALSFATAGLALCLRERPPWVWVGAIAGLAVTMNHSLVLAMGAPALAAWTSPRRRAALGGFVGAFVAMTLVENLHHLLALGSLLRFESHAQYPALPYEILGLDLRWEGLVNWPLHTDVVRTPHNPFPMLVAWPLWILDHFGALLSAFMLTGFAVVWTFSQRAAGVWLLWWAPTQLALSLQEAWDYPNKMGALLVVTPALVAWVLAGARMVVRKPSAAGGVVMVLTGALLLGSESLGGWRAPVDERYLELHGANAENALYVDARARTESDVGALPDYERAAERGTYWTARKLDALAAGAADPTLQLEMRPWGWYPDEPAPDGAARTVEIDLAKPPFGGAPAVRVVEAEPTVDLTGSAGPVAFAVAGLEVPWDERPAGAYVWRHGGVSTVTLFFTHPDERAQVCDCSGDRKRRDGDCGPRCEIVEFIAGTRLGGGRIPTRHVRTTGPVLRVRIPSPSFGVSLLLNPRGRRVLLWKGDARASPPIGEVRELWHN